MKNLSFRAIFLILATSLFAFAARPSHMRVFKMPTPKADIYIVSKPMTTEVLLKYPAQIKSFKNVKVVSRVSGILEKKYFIEGEKVNKGELLYKIEDSVYKAKVDGAKASLQMAKAVLSNAVRNWNRIKKLYIQKAVSQEKKDDALSAYEQAKASLSLSKARLEQAQINLAYTKVVSPISGIAGLKKVDVGDFVTSTPPTTLVNIINDNKVYISFSMPFSDYINIKNHLWQIPENKKIRINVIINGKTLKEKGVVDFIDPNVDQKTSVVRFRAILDNKNGYLMPGSFAKIILRGISQKNVIMIPQKAVLQNPLGTVVFVVKDGHVGVLPVILGRESGKYYIVKRSHLKSGDKVIINNFFRLRPGGKVIIDKIINNQGK